MSYLNFIVCDDVRNHTVSAMYTTSAKTDLRAFTHEDRLSDINIGWTFPMGHMSSK